MTQADSNLSTSEAIVTLSEERITKKSWRLAVFSMCSFRSRGEDVYLLGLFSSDNRHCYSKTGSNVCTEPDHLLGLCQTMRYVESSEVMKSKQG